MENVTQIPVVGQLKETFNSLRAASVRLRKESIAYRIARLKRLEKWLHANRERINAAVHADFGKPSLEVDTSELYPALVELRHALKHMNQWARPKKIDATLSYIGTYSEIRYEPKGVCLIIAPWNFPFNLCIGPLISCLAAGNTAIIKPSELTPHTSTLISDLVKENFEEDVVIAVEGGVDVTSELLRFPFDHIFFTGSPAVGKIVMEAAAKNLTSVTLELGGKSPTIIDKTAHLRDAAKRIAFGKFMNNGQTCIAPDYILIESSVKEKFVNALKEEIQNLFGAGKAVGLDSVDYSRIVNARHFQRVNGLLKDAIERGAIQDLPASVDEKTNFISPTILSEIPGGSRILEEEIFGPLLPILTFQNKEEVVSLINDKEKPLALYVFSQSKDFREYVLQNTSAGGVCINDCILQFTHPNLPFGGVNNSGIGKSHGYFGFMAFSNEKPVLRQKNGWAGPYLLYPPYTSKMKRVVDILLKWF